jgi:hypothetical protein
MPLPVRWSDILALRPLPPLPAAARTLFLWGDRAVQHVGLRTAARVVVTGQAVAIIDAGMAFDVHPFVAMARAARVTPETVLQRVHVTRTFTCWQCTTLVCDRLQALLHDHPISLIVLLDPLTQFFDEDITYKEAYFLFQRILTAITANRRHGPSLLVIQTVPLPPSPRRWFARDLLGVVDVGLRLQTHDRRWQVDLVKPRVLNTRAH